MFASFVETHDVIDPLAAESYSPEILGLVRYTTDCKSLSAFLQRKPRLGVTGSIESEYVERSTPNAVPYITTKQIRGLFAHTDDCKFITHNADQKWAKCRVFDGDILINKSGDVGAAAIIRTAPFAHCNSVSDIINIRLKESGQLNPYFLVLFLNSPWGQAQLQRLSGGAVFDHVSLFAIPEIKVPLPPIEMQQLFGELVDSVDQLRLAAKEVDDAVETSLSQILGSPPKEEGVGDRRGWFVPHDDIVPRLDAEFYLPEYVQLLHQMKSRVCTLKLAEIEEKGGYGVLPSSDEYGHGPLPLIRGKDLTGGFLIIPHDAPRVPATYSSRQSARVSPFEVLLLIKGATIDSPRSVGVVPESWYVDAIVNGSIYKFSVKSEVNPYYVCAFMGTPFGLRQKKRAIANTGISYNDQESIRDFVIAIPDKETQDHIGGLLKLGSAYRERSVRLLKSLNDNLATLVVGSLDIEGLEVERRELAEWLKSHPLPEHNGRNDQ